MKNDICLIDDDSTSTYITTLVLEKYVPNISFQTFNDGAIALDFLKHLSATNQELPKYIFLDIDMPMDAWKFLNDLDRLNIDPKFRSKIYLLSISVFQSDWKRGLDHPRVNGFFSKPLKLADVRKAFN